MSTVDSLTPAPAGVPVLDVDPFSDELLRDPYWPLHAAEALGHRLAWPPQYVRAAQRDTPIRELGEELD